jgi:hypothetical protein
MTSLPNIVRLPLTLLLITICGCGPGAPEDAGVDASLDAAERPDVPRDTGPPCDLSCGSTEACCYVEEVAQCTDVSSNVNHCGDCAIDCVASHRGDSCENRQCACGMNDIGCTGTIDECCPGVEGGIEPHCANVRVAFGDCGACGVECSAAEASICQNGACVCGSAERGCAGTPDDLCCDVGPLGTYGCVDTLANRNHCGACGMRCRSDQRCDAGACVSRFDAGTEPDAGIDDAGVEDAGIDDGGTDDDAG